MTTAMSAHQEAPPRERLAPPSWPIKRNKRKDFKPRCAPADLEPEEQPLPTNNQHEQEYNDVDVDEGGDEHLENNTDINDDDVSDCVKIKNFMFLKGNDAVDLSGRRLSTDSNENIESGDYRTSQHIYDYSEHQKRLDNIRNISTQFQQSYIQSLNDVENDEKRIGETQIETEFKTKNFSTNSPFAISQLIKTNSPTRRRDSENSIDQEDDDAESARNDDQDNSPNHRSDDDSPEPRNRDGNEPMDVEDGVEEEVPNGETPNNKLLTDYAVNTMKELLGIYGLSSNEVAEALSGQVRAIEALQSGKIYPLWLQKRWAQGPLGHVPPISTISNPYVDESEAQSPIETQRSNSIQDESAISGGESDGEKTLDLSISKEPDVQDLSTTSSAANSISDFDHHTMLMRRNLEDLAGLHGMFNKPSLGHPVTEELLNQDLQSKLTPAALLASLGQLDSRRQSVVPTLDYSRYVKRFSSALECGSSYCKDLGYREHFHCLDCSGRVFCKKEEMIRHFKWHKKRDESLAHGFMRYSPLDDCGERGPGCPHNRSQTHYHCIQDGCDKVYISTSDVQMHANYHRKDSAILQEGFQRFRATEKCSAPHCAFRGQRTTHFHCRRPGCKYTFKNKADMEKHKTYHIKDEQLARDGFKKYMKNEPCPYRDCRFSRMCNHIHCIRPRCNYVLHSSSQLFSHKRKHERKDQEMSFGGLPSSVLQQSMFQPPGDDSSGMKIKSPLSPKSGSIGAGEMDESSMSGMFGPPPLLPLQPNIEITAGEGTFDPQMNLNQLVVDEISKKYIHTFNGGTGPEDKCEKCSAFNKHFHCLAEGCNMAHSCQSTMMKHALEHEHQNQVTEAYFQTSTKNNPCNNPSCLHFKDVTHYHCTWENCGCVILPSEDQPFRRLEHHRQHALLSPLSPPLARLAHALNPNNLQSLQGLSPALQVMNQPGMQSLTPPGLQGLPPSVIQSQPTSVHPGAASSLDEMFSRKRGRPPKNRVVEVWADHVNTTPQAIFTSFKLPKNSLTPVPQSPMNCLDDMKLKFQHFDVYTAPDSCIQYHPSCQIRGAKLHMHCSHCAFSSDNHTSLETHARETHSVLRLIDGFDYYPSFEECGTRGCIKSQLRSHFHCVQTQLCGVILTQYSSLLNHKHINPAKDGMEIDYEANLKAIEARDYSMKAREVVAALDGFHGTSITVKNENDNDNTSVSVVKAAGTFYPSSNDRASTSPITSSRPPMCQNCLRPNESGHVCTQIIPSHGSFDAPGLAATKETLEREYPEISILPSTASSTPSPQTQKSSNQMNNISTTPPSQSGNQNQPGQVNQTVQSLLLQQYLAQASAKPTNMQDHLKYQQMGIPGIPGLSPSQIAQMAFLSHRSPFPLYPGMMYPPELLMEQPNLMASSSGMPSASLLKNEKDDFLAKRSHTTRGTPNMRMLKDEPIPEGYLRFRFNEDCGYQHCGYREHQTHFHCTRRDCGYSFCDKTRFVQHTARHERLDTLMGGDFQQYRANVFCGRSDCAHANNFGATQNKASHFHCLKCDFVCTDTNKVVAHRRQHQKMDSIQAAGFEKFPPSKGCGYESQCIHSKKQTHYHCLQCGFAVLGLSQMTSHKYRHQENSQGIPGTSGM